MKRVGGKKLKTGSVTTVPGKRVQSKKGVTTIDQPADANIIDAIQAKIETIKENIRNAPLPSAQESNSNKKCPFCEDNLFTQLIQIRSGDEAAQLFGTCLNEKCPKYSIALPVADSE